MNTTETARACTRCSGEGRINYGEHGTKDCTWCRRRGVNGFYDRPDFKAVLTALVATKGKNKGTIRASAPEYKMANLQACRIYYVWRMFRFHAGLDVTMPMTAHFLIESDPWAKELDALASAAAQHVTGHASAGAVRWGRALGSLSEADAAKLDPTLPASARPGGPVADADKPAEEAHELYTDEELTELQEEQHDESEGDPQGRR